MANLTITLSAALLTHLEEPRDVGDVDPQLPVAVRKDPRMEGVVDVAATGRVHAADADVTEVLALRLVAVLLRGAVLVSFGKRERKKGTTGARRLPGGR